MRVNLKINNHVAECTSVPDRILSKLELEGNFFHLIKVFPVNLPLASYLVVKDSVIFPLRSRARQGYLFSPLLLSIVLEVLARKNKKHPDWKRKSKTVSICRLHDCRCRKCIGIYKTAGTIKWAERDYTIQDE